MNPDRPAPFGPPPRSRSDRAPAARRADHRPILAATTGANRCPTVPPAALTPLRPASLLAPSSPLRTTTS